MTVHTNEMKLRTDSMYTLEGPTTMAQGSGMKLGRRTPQGGQQAHALGGLPRPDSHRRSRANAGRPAGSRPGLQVKLKHPGQASRHVPIGGVLSPPQLQGRAEGPAGTHSARDGGASRHTHPITNLAFRVEDQVDTRLVRPLRQEDCRARPARTAGAPEPTPDRSPRSSREPVSRLGDRSTMVLL